MRYAVRYISVLSLAIALAACGMGGKQSAVEGKLLDGYGKPVAGVKITAAQVQPIKGYEQFEAVTSSDGSFRIRGLFPSSQYVLKPWSDKWTCDTAVRLDSAPQGETAVLPTPMVIRFTVSSEGVIGDSQTGLEWVVGPDRNTNYAQAEQWVSACKAAGGGWRMPTRAELKTLYQRGLGEGNMDPAFKTTGIRIWAEPKDSSSAWHFDFKGGFEDSYFRYDGPHFRVFGVRSRSRR